MTFCFIQALERGYGATYGSILNALRNTIRSVGGGDLGGGVVTSLITMLLTGGSVGLGGGLRQVIFPWLINWYLSVSPTNKFNCPSSKKIYAFDWLYTMGNILNTHKHIWLCRCTWKQHLRLQQTLLKSLLLKQPKIWSYSICTVYNIMLESGIWHSERMLILLIVWKPGILQWNINVNFFLAPCDR